MARDNFVHRSLGSKLHERIKTARVLMVGAGGIGCELLKNLVLTGFGEIHIVDLDTIDLSNLNRQFLFRHEHIKKSKALVARESAGKFNPNVKIEAHHANIKDPQFDVDWFQSFVIVFNALDNLDARRHVNKMCLAADVPLIESGTTGFNGQVQVIRKGQTECYDCNVKETPKTFPVCTIRSTPSQPIHCIVWGKSYLFMELFGTSEDDAPELDHSEDKENSEEIAKLREEAQALQKIKDSIGSEDFPKMIFEKVFRADIERLRSMEDMWKSRKPPEPLDYEQIKKQAMSVGNTIAQQDQSVWTLAENFAVFVDSTKRLSKRLEELRTTVESGSGPSILSFDKDDPDTLDFVAASANLRSFVFGIETRSKFDIKQMAGNIIPAIATTNAMTAGLCVMQAFKVLQNQLQKARMVFLVKSTERVISSEALRPPKPSCPVCMVAQTRLVIDPARATMNHLVEDLLRLDLGYSDQISIMTEKGLIYDMDLEENLPKKMSELGIEKGGFVTVVDDEEENPRVNLVLEIAEETLPEDSKPIVVPTKLNIPRKPRATSEPAKNGSALTTNGVSAASEITGTKRKRPLDDTDIQDDQIHKKGKGPELNGKSNANVVVIDDDGAIMIND